MKKTFAAILAAGMMLLATAAMAQGHGSDWTEIKQSSFTDGEMMLAGGKYCLAEDVQGTIQNAEEKMITLCLCGHTISAEDAAVIHIAAGDGVDWSGSLTLEDCSAAQSGKVEVIDGPKPDPCVGVMNDYGTFIMNGGSVIAQGEDSYGVENGSGTFIMNGGVVEGYFAVGNETAEESGQPAVFTMNGGTVKGTLLGVFNATDSDAYERGVVSTFNMNSGTVSGGVYGGVCNVLGKLTVSAGEISGAKLAVMELEGEPLTEEEAEKAYLAKDSRKVEGEFTSELVIVEKIPAADSQTQTDDLPKTGDPSSLLGWAALLGASVMGMKMRRRSK